jgi:oxygen-dependent protoporphyrinogen oxidase
VAVIGGGITGLAAAHRLVELDPACRVTLIDARPRLGGVVSTIHEDGFQVEQSSDNFITTTPWALELCRRLGLTDQLVQTNPTCRRTFVVHAGRLCALPDGFLMMAPTQMWPLAITPILSPLGKLRAAMEYFIPPQAGDADETMANFVRRRLGREAFERLVEPLISAVYAADMEKLSVLATLPRFREMERNHGSLIRAMRHQMKHRPKKSGESGARYSLFVTLRDGLGCLIDAMASRLPPGAIQTNTCVDRIERHGEGWRVWSKSSAGSSNEASAELSNLDVDAIILATPSHEVARLLAPHNADMAADLKSIAHSGSAIVSLGFETKQIGRPVHCMGAVVPAIEKSPILALSFSSTKYPHRAPEGKMLLRVFVGGARRPEFATMDDDKLCPIVMREVAGLLKIHGEPCYVNVAHWPNTMPQYHVGHKELIARIEAQAAGIANLQLAGNAYHGVGLPDCIHSGEQAAEKILATGNLPPD